MGFGLVDHTANVDRAPQRGVGLPPGSPQRDPGYPRIASISLLDWPLDRVEIDPLSSRPSLVVARAPADGAIVPWIVCRVPREAPSTA